jgi:hypothetical protein
LKIICHLDYLVNKIINFFYPVLLKITFCLLIIFTLNNVALADVPYPDYTGEKVLDLSHKFDSNYLGRLENDLDQYEPETEIRIVFIDSKNQINLGFYAPKLFDHWKMSEDSILVVIDPYLNKTGYGLGKKVIEKLKTRKQIDEKDVKKATQPDINIDYNNLPAAIADKFAAEIPKVIPQENSGPSVKPGKQQSGGDNGPLVQGNTSNSSDNKPHKPGNPYTLRIILAIILLLIIGGAGGFFYNRKQKIKKQLELKTTYSFEGEILTEQLAEIMEKITVDTEKMAKFKGQTKKELIPHIEKLKSILEKGTLFSEKLANSLEEIDLDNLYYIFELLDEGKMVLENMEQLHKESVAFRKEYKAILEKNSMHLSDIRVNIENCRNLLEEMRTLYTLSLEFSENKINDCEALLIKAQELINRNDPLEYRGILNEIHETIRILKKDFDIIPHLYKQLQESIPVSINSSLEVGIPDNNEKVALRDEISRLRLTALENLAKGNLEPSEKLINEIFARLNELKSNYELKSEA